MLLIALALAGAAACFALDDGAVEFIGAPNADVTVEFGEPIPRQEIAAVYKSTVFHRAGVPLEVEADVLPPRTAPGEYTLRYTASYRDTLAEGHSIGAHAYRHDYKRVYASDEAYFDDLGRIQQEIASRIGTETKLIRFPGGSSNTVSRKYCVGIMRRLTRAVEERGYAYFDWNVSSGDAGAVHTTEAVVNNVKSGILKQHVAVVLQHDVKAFSVAGVEEIIRWGQEQGFVFLPLTERSTAPHHGVSN